MGNSNSSDPVVNLLKKVVDENTNSSVCSEVSVTGGGDMLDEYKITESSAARNIIIKKLAYGISRALNTEPPSENASPDEMIAHLMRIIPNPRLGKSIAARENIQIDVCERMADVVNEGYGNIIDKTLGPIGIVNQISDVINSLGAGIHKEFISISASVSIALSNLNTIRDMLNRSYTKLNNTIIKNGDATAVRKANSLSSMHKIIMDEFSRQIAMLSNLTHSVLRPVDSDIVKILKDNKDFEGLVARIKSRIGTSEWGDRIGFWLSNMGGVAQMALRVDTALKDIGMSLSAYKESRNIEDLVMNVHSALESVPKSNMTKEYLEKYTDAINTLKKFHNSHDIIADHLTKNMESKIGGTVMPLTKKINTQLKTRIVLLEDFKMKSNILISRVYDSIIRMSRLLNIGEIPITPELTHFKNLLKDLANIFSEGSEYALTGYYTHANAVTHKERFVDILNSMLVYANTLAPLSNVFSELGRSIGDLLKLIDFYNDKFHIHTSNVATTKTGGGTIYKSVATLKNAKNMLVNAYSVSKMRENLKYAAANREDYNKKYNEIVGTSIAQVIDNYSTIIDTKLTILKSETSYGEAEKDSNDVYHTLFNSGDWTKDSVISKLEYERDTKIELFRYCQIIDRELLEYADDVAANPSLIQEISRMLESVDIVSNWFNDEKGNLLATYFEVLTPNYDICTTDVRDNIYGNTTDVNNLKTKLTNSTEHYYKYLENSIFAQYNLAMDKGGFMDQQLQTKYNTVITPYIFNLQNPIWVESPNRELLGLYFNKHIRDKSYALKNIVSIYSSLCPTKSNGIGYNPKSLYNTLSTSYGGKVVGNKNSLKLKRAQKRKRLALVKGGGPLDPGLIQTMMQENETFKGDDCDETREILTRRMTTILDLNNELKNVSNTATDNNFVPVTNYGSNISHMTKRGHMYSGLKTVAYRLLDKSSYASTEDIFARLNGKIASTNNDTKMEIPNCGDTFFDDDNNKTLTKNLFSSYENMMYVILQSKYLGVNVEHNDKRLYKNIQLEVFPLNATSERFKVKSVLPYIDVIPLAAHAYIGKDMGTNANSIFATVYEIATYAGRLVSDFNDGVLWYKGKFDDGLLKANSNDRHYKDLNNISKYSAFVNTRKLQSQPPIRILATAFNYYNNNDMNLNDIFISIENKHGSLIDYMTPYIKGMGTAKYFDTKKKNEYFARSMDNLTNLLLLFKLFIIDTNRKIANNNGGKFSYVVWSLLDIVSRINREVLTIKQCCMALDMELVNTILSKPAFKTIELNDNENKVLDHLNQSATMQNVEIASMVNIYMAKIKEAFPTNRRKTLSKDSFTNQDENYGVQKPTSYNKNKENKTKWNNGVVPVPVPVLKHTFSNGSVDSTGQSNSRFKARGNITGNDSLNIEQKLDKDYDEISQMKDVRQQNTRIKQVFVNLQRSGFPRAIADKHRAKLNRLLNRNNSNNEKEEKEEKDGKEDKQSIRRNVDKMYNSIVSLKDVNQKRSRIVQSLQFIKDKKGKLPQDIADMHAARLTKLLNDINNNNAKPVTRTGIADTTKIKEVAKSEGMGNPVDDEAANVDLDNVDLANVDLANVDLANVDLANVDLDNVAPAQGTSSTRSTIKNKASRARQKARRKAKRKDNEKQTGANADVVAQLAFGAYDDYDYESEDDEYGEIVGGTTTDIYKNAKTNIKEREVKTEDFDDNFMENIDVHIVKAMVAKILSATGLYNMLQYSKSFALTHRTPLDPVRLILGGDPYSGTPEIYPEIMCLYVRLPLLVEFYRDLFCFDTQCDDDTYDDKIDGYLISMAPEVGSVWADLIQTIFEQPLITSQTGTYSDNTVKRIIHCINRVYQSFKSNYTKPDIVTHIIENFVSEVNNRYGVMRRSEIVKYINDKRSRDNSMTYGDSNEKEYGFYLNPVNNSFTVPSDRYSGTVTNIKTRDDTLDLYRAVNTFLNRIEKRMENINIPHIDIEKICLITTDSLKKIPDKEKRYKETKSAMFDMERHDESRTDINIMFHETILTPLAVLTKITRILMKYRDIIATRDIKAAKIIADDELAKSEKIAIDRLYTGVEFEKFLRLLKFYIGYVILKTPAGEQVDHIGGVDFPYNIPDIDPDTPNALQLDDAQKGTAFIAFVEDENNDYMEDELDNIVLSTDIYKTILNMHNRKNKIYNGGFCLDVLFPASINITVNGETNNIPFYSANSANVIERQTISHVGCILYHNFVYIMNIYAEKNNSDVVYGKIFRKYDEYKKKAELTDDVKQQIVANTILGYNALAPVTREARYNQESRSVNLQAVKTSYKRAYSREHFGFAGDDSKEPITWISHLNSQRIQYNEISEIVTRAILTINYDLGSLCDIQISIDKHVNIDFSGLHRVCSEVFAGVKKYFGLFRNRVDNSIMKRMDVSSDFVGSIAWIQHNLFDTLFGNKITYNNMSLGYINKIVNNNIEEITNIKKSISHINGLYDSHIPNNIDCSGLFIRGVNRYSANDDEWKDYTRRRWSENINDIINPGTAHATFLQSQVEQYFDDMPIYISHYIEEEGGAPLVVVNGRYRNRWQKWIWTSYNMQNNDHTPVEQQMYYDTIIRLFILTTGNPTAVVERLLDILLQVDSVQNCNSIDMINANFNDEVAEFNRCTGYTHMPNPFKKLTRIMEKHIFPKNYMGCSIEMSMKNFIYAVEFTDTMRNEAIADLTFGELFKDYYEVTKQKQIFINWESRLPLYYNPKNNVGRIGFKDGKEIGDIGILLRFNELVSQYFSKFWDTSVNKIYAPLIEVPANGPLRSSIFKNTGFPDIIKVRYHLPDNLATVVYNMPNILPPIGVGNDAVGYYLGLVDDANEPYDRVMYMSYNREKQHMFDLMALIVLFISNEHYEFDPWPETALYENYITNNIPGAQHLEEFWKSVVFRYTYILSHRILMTALEHFSKFQTENVLRASIPSLAKTILVYRETVYESFNKYCRLMAKLLPCYILEWYPCFESMYDTLNFDFAIELVRARIDHVYRIITTEKGKTINIIINLASTLKFPENYDLIDNLAIMTMGSSIDFEFKELFSTFNWWGNEPSSALYTLDLNPPLEQDWDPITYLKRISFDILEYELSQEEEAKEMVAYVAKDVVYGDIITDDILYTSLSRSIHRALTYTDNKNLKPYIIQSLSEVPLRIKEEMKAYLPVFSNLFRSLSKNASLIKHMCKIYNDECFEPDHAFKTAFGYVFCHYVEMNEYHTIIDELYTPTGFLQKSVFIGIIDKIIAACLSFSVAIDNVISDLNDTALYMEVGDNSMLKYKNRTNQIPFTPLSSLTYVCKEYDKSTKFGSLVYGSGDYDFMFSYGIRGTIHDYNTIPVFDRMLGIKHILDNYNITSADTSVLETRTYEYYIKNIIELFRFTYSINLYSFTGGGELKILEKDTRPEYVAYYENKNSYLPYQMYDEVNIAEVVSLTTSDDYTKSSNYISDAVSLISNQDNTRASIALHNIADLEICPIDLHAMRREIPLINIMNYSHACDRMITSIVNRSTGGSNITYQTNSPAGLYLKLCRNPYTTIDYEEFRRDFKELVENGGPAGEKSRYLYNQLWCKVLIQNSSDTELIDHKNNAYPVGPTAVEAFRQLGYSRFNTKIIRDDIFHVLLHKIILYAINKELTNVIFPVSTGNAVASNMIIQGGPDDDDTFIDI